MPRDFLEFPREASPAVSLYPNSNLCKCAKGFLLCFHSVGAPQGGTPHSKLGPPLLCSVAAKRPFSKGHLQLSSPTIMGSLFILSTICFVVQKLFKFN